MKIEHIAIWTKNLENLKKYYSKYFGGIPNEKYVNSKTGFQSYFLHFESGARLELMKKADIPDNQNDTVKNQHMGIIHIAFEAPNRQEVDKKAMELKGNGYPILRGPRVTGDGYYEFETLDPDNNRLEVICKE